MKKQLTLKYPHSANLFSFCKRVLSHKLGGKKTIDQDVGHLLGFDPADCSHWKKGKKSVHSIFAMRKIAKHLDIDESLLLDLAIGDIDEDMAYQEFLGYGKNKLDAKTLDLAKREAFKMRWSRESELDFRKSFTIDSSHIQSVVENIHKQIKFEEAPLYLEEVCLYYPDIILESVEKFSGDESVCGRFEKNKLIISFKQGTENQPYIRYQIAKAMAAYFLKGKALTPELKQFQKDLSNVETNIFASNLLAPYALIRKEIQNINPSKDALSQLAEIFWVSKAFMNLRLMDLVLEV